MFKFLQEKAMGSYVIRGM